MTTGDTEGVVRRLATALDDLPTLIAVDATQVRRSVGRRRRRRRVALASVTLLVAAGGVGSVLIASHQGDAERDLRTAATPIVLSQGRSVERYSSLTAADWARHADVVAVVRVTAEQQGAVTGADDGSRDRFVARSVSADVEQVLWERGTAEVPATVDVGSTGWIQRGNVLHPLAYERSPRLEIGEQYVVALMQPCAIGAREKHLWEVVGSGAAIPLAGGRLGHGESEGRPTEGDRSQALPGSLEEQVIGTSVDGVERALATAPVSHSDPDRCDP